MALCKTNSNECFKMPSFKDHKGPGGRGGKAKACSLVTVNC